MKLEFKNIPNWVNPALQGLAYCIGYKKQMYWRYHFSEGFITSELYTLLNSHKKSTQIVLAEFPFEKMLDGFKLPKRSGSDDKNTFDGNIKKSGRMPSVDIIVVDDSNMNANKKSYDSLENRKSNDFILPKDAEQFLFEIKLFEGEGNIDYDFTKVNSYLLANEKARGFSLIVIQNGIIDKNGKPKTELKINGEPIIDVIINNTHKEKIKKTRTILNFHTDTYSKENYSFKVRRIYKASATMQVTHKSIFILLVEILPIIN